MEKLELKFSREKETKNTWRYREDESEAAHGRGIVCGTIYIKKECLGKPVPRRLKIIIEES